MSNSNQEIIEAKLATYIDGELDDADRAELEVHLEQNPQYRRLVDELRKGREMLRSLPRQAAPPELAEAFTSQLERSVLLAGETDKEEPRMRIGAIPRLLATAAILFLTFGLAAIVYFVLPGHGGHPVAIAPPSTQVATAGNDDPSNAVANPDDKETPDELSHHLKTAAAPTGPGNASKETLADQAPKTELATAGPNSSQGALALKKTMGNRAEVALQSGPRDRAAEFEQLAREVSADPQVKELLSYSVTDKLRARVAGESANHAVVMVCRASDPEQVKKELYAYFGDHNIDWQPAPAHLELAINSPRAQQNEQLKVSDPQAMREARSGTGDQPRTVDEAEKKHAGVAKAAPFNPAAPAPAVADAPGAAEKQRPTASPAQAAGGARGAAPLKPGAAPVAPGAAPAAPGAAPPAPSAAPPAPSAAPPAPSAAPAPPSVAPAAPSAAPPAPAAPSTTVWAERQLPDVKQPTAEKQQLAPAQTTVYAVDKLYVARRLSRRQAEELTQCLARNGEVRETGVSPPAVESEIAGKRAIAPAPEFKFAATKDKGDATARAPAEAVKSGADPVGNARSADASLGQKAQDLASDTARKDSAAYRRMGSATHSDDLVKKGDELRLSYAGDNGAPGQAETVVVKDDGTIEPLSVASTKGKPVKVAGKTLGEIEQELRKTAAETPAPTPVQPVRVSRLDIDGGRGAGAGRAFGAAGKGGAAPGDIALADQRRASTAPAVEGAAALPATHPALAADADNFIDVVIVVQKESSAGPAAAAPAAPPAPVIAAPAAPPAPVIAAPAAPPAPVIAPPASPAPATQPAPPRE